MTMLTLFISKEITLFKRGMQNKVLFVLLYVFEEFQLRIYICLNITFVHLNSNEHSFNKLHIQIYFILVIYN